MDPEARLDAAIQLLCAKRPPHIENYSRYDLVKGVTVLLKLPSHKHIYRSQVFSDLAIFAREKYGIRIIAGHGAAERDQARKESLNRKRDSPFPPRPEINVVAGEDLLPWLRVDGPLYFTPSTLLSFLDEYINDRVSRHPPNGCSHSFPLMLSRFAMGLYQEFIVYNCFGLTHFWHRIEYSHMHEFVSLQPKWIDKFHRTPFLVRVPMMSRPVTMTELKDRHPDAEKEVLDSLALPTSAPKWVGYRKAVVMFAVSVKSKSEVEGAAPVVEIDPLRLLGPICDKEEGAKEQPELLWDEGGFNDWRDMRVVVKPEGSRLCLLVQREIPRAPAVAVPVSESEEEGEGAETTTTTTAPSEEEAGGEGEAEVQEQEQPIEELEDTPETLLKYFDPDLPRIAAYIEHLLARDPESDLEVESIQVVSSRILRADVGYVWLILAQRPFLLLPNLEGVQTHGTRLGPFKIPPLFDSLMIHNRELQEEAARRRRERQAKRLADREQRKAKIAAAKAVSEARKKKQAEERERAAVEGQQQKKTAREMFARQLLRFRNKTKGETDAEPGTESEAETDAAGKEEGEQEQPVVPADAALEEVAEVEATPTAEVAGGEEEAPPADAEPEAAEAEAGEAEEAPKKDGEEE